MSLITLRTITALGLICSIIVTVGFPIYKDALGVPYLILEGAGFGIFGFVCGYQKYSIAILFALTVTILAVLLDPAIWTYFALPSPYDMKIFSIKLNGLLFTVFAILYITGGIVRHKSG